MKISCVACLSLWIIPSAFLFAEVKPTVNRGKVIAASVQGKVEVIDDGSKSSRNLKTKDVISEKHTVKVGEASASTLVFSNGATISLQQKSELVISEFLQDPFSVPFSVAAESEESTVSTTKLNLSEGEVICKVKKLRIDEGSSLTISTPVGAAGVRGTTFAVTYSPNPDGNGQGTYTLSVTEGEVSMTDANGNVTIITAGREIEITFRSQEDPVTGEITITEILSREVRDIPAARLEMINRVAEEGEANADTIVFEVGDGDLLDNVPTIAGETVVVNNPDPVTEVNPPSNFEPQE
jgi:hypothetical protein